MQILFFVISMLLLLAAMTYAKMESYKSVVLFRNQLESYSDVSKNRFDERFYDALYEETSMDSKQGGTKANSGEGFAFIGLTPLLTESPEGEENRNFSKKLLKEIIPVLYEDQSFYQQMVSKRPSFANDLVEELTKALQHSIKNRGKPPKKIEEIANIEFEDPLLAEGWYKMLKGFMAPRGEKTELQEEYPSIIDYLTLRGDGKIRLYLAPRPLLYVLFGESGTADEAAALRMELYNDVKSDRVKPEQATKTFEEAFQTRLRSDIPPGKIDFSVSKTNPKRTPRVRFL
ncbi:hypothetical protein [Estrella lausannensis]|uniref:Putative membrane protein n=1 Tax=Estrella lausannensis TaxID=483423 RepID=A0A0H5E2J1_9BACT|nr:hypothetical protein [Estrella lausannensis]CRX37410.1 putative membrane protein [Estrella lausannensis]